MSKAEQELARLIAEHRLSGASFGYWDGSQMHTAVAGRRNSVTGDPVTTDTLMHVGSIAKLINAVLVMQLVDERLIDLDAPFADYLPDVRLRDCSALRRISCAMLLNHSSGIDGDWLPRHGPDEERIVDAVMRSAELEHLHEPGEAVSYCNVATVIAGHLVQTVRAQSWYQLVVERIFEPLGLEHSLVDPAETPRFRCSVGDLTELGTGRMIQSSQAFLSPSFAPAGSTAMMTASDLVQFARTLMRGGVGVNGARILSAASAERMTQPTGSFLSPAYAAGLGWMIAPGNLLTHSGAGPGVSSFLFAEPRSGKVLALLTNCDRGNLLKGAFIDPILSGWTQVPMEDDPRSWNGQETGAFVGRFENNLMVLDVEEWGGALTAKQRFKLPIFDNSPYGPLADLAPRCRLRPVGQDRFMSEPALPAGAEFEIRFAGPDNVGRMEFAGVGFRLLRRAS